jgi:hypothetical protein
VHVLAFGFPHSTTLLLHEIPYLQLTTSLVREQASLVLFTLMIHIRPFVSVYGYFTWNSLTFFYVNTTSVKLCFFNFVTLKGLASSFWLLFETLLFEIFWLPFPQLYYLKGSGFFSQLCYLKGSSF